MTGEDFAQFIGRQRTLGVVTFHQVNLKLGAQELPRAAASGSGRTPEKSRLLHDVAHYSALFDVVFPHRAGTRIARSGDASGEVRRCAGGAVSAVPGGH